MTNELCQSSTSVSLIRANTHRTPGELTRASKPEQACKRRITITRALTPPPRPTSAYWCSSPSSPKS
jgi:hypothetical protein